MLAVEPQAVALGWDFFGPLITETVTAMQSFDDAELATVSRFLHTIADLVDTTRTPPTNREDATPSPATTEDPG